MKTLNDLTAPRQPVRKLLEKDVQAACVKWAREQCGLWARKFSSMTQNSVPDYLFAGKGWPMFAIEFKAPGKKPTEAQTNEITAMRAACWYVFVCDDLDVFKGLVMSLKGRSNE